MTKRTVSVKWLTANDACEPQIELFRATFGKSVRVTKSSLLRAAEAGLDLLWFASYNDLWPEVSEINGRLAAAINSIWERYEVDLGPIYNQRQEEYNVVWERFYTRKNGDVCSIPDSECDREFGSVDAKYNPLLAPILLRADAEIQLAKIPFYTEAAGVIWKALKDRS